MVILLNGAFGIGKTTLARLLVKKLPRASIFNPELIGFVLQRAVALTGRRVDDFQDLALWRRLVIAGVRGMTLMRRSVIVPMAFSNVAYLDEIRNDLAARGIEVIHLCLVAPVEVVHDRITRRASGVHDDDVRWQLRRAAECCVAHESDVFGERIPVGDMQPEELAEQLIERFRR